MVNREAIAHDRKCGTTAASYDRPWSPAARRSADVTQDICAPMERRPTALWWTAFGVVLHRAGGRRYCRNWYQIAMGIGTWGLESSTVGWAFDITNFVFWVGIGHAGTLISAVLFSVPTKVADAVNRSAEAMTLFAVMCAGIFPVDSHGYGHGWRSGWFLIPTHVDRCG